MGHRWKHPKGEISINNYRGRIKIRWSYLKERYELNMPFYYLPENLHHAQIKVLEIKLDMIKGCFDTSLARYKAAESITEASANASLPVQEDSPISPFIPLSQPAVALVAVQPVPVKLDETPIALTFTDKPIFLNDLYDKFTYWTTNIRNIDIENSFDYHYTRRLLEKWVNVPFDDVAGQLGSETWATSTYNRRLNYFTTFFDWMVSHRELPFNPLEQVIRRRDKYKKKNPRREPLTEEQIHLFLEAIRNDTYCDARKHYKHSFYYPFVLFIFFTGVRNAEAVGLKVKYVDLMKKEIEIVETFARTIKGTHHAARIEKGTKMGNSRFLPLSPELEALITPYLEGKGSEELVFLSPNGKSIDDSMLQRRTLKPVLIALGIGDRDLYAARHSFGTRAAQQNMAPTDLAYLMGHSTIYTAIKNYIGLKRRDIPLPTLSPNVKQ